jgi:hypothetical protein
MCPAQPITGELGLGRHVLIVKQEPRRKSMD